jgi:hypothetical protein
LSFSPRLRTTREEDSHGAETCLFVLFVAPLAGLFNF